MLGGNSWSSLRDFIVLCVLLAAANWLLARADFGWMQLNPTPWLLAPVLIGARYGFASGFSYGIAAAGLIAAVRLRLVNAAPSVDDFTTELHEHAATLLSIALSGAAVGELRAIIRRHVLRMERDNKKLDAENARLQSQLDVVRETRHQLQQQLAFYNAPLAGLDEELARLFAAPQEKFQDELLRCLHRITGVTSAGFYAVEKATHLQRTAVIHPTRPLIEKLELSESTLAQTALDTNTLASVTSAALLSPAQPFLAALPWVDQLGQQAVLLIQDMPLDAFDLQHLARVELILKWTSELANLQRAHSSHATKDRTVDADDFKRLLADATKTACRHALPSTVLNIDGVDKTSLRGTLRLLPATAVAARLDGARSLAVLLPFCSETEALETARKLTDAQPALMIEHHVITDDSAGSKTETP